MFTFVPPLLSSISSSPFHGAPPSSCFSCRRQRSRCINPRPASASIANVISLSINKKNFVANEIETIDPSSTDALISRLDTLLLPPSSEILYEMVRHLADSRGLSRLALVDKFGQIGSSAVPILLQFLNHNYNSNPVIRRSCAKALAKIGDSQATQTLLEVLVHDPDTVTRSSAAGALAKMGTTAIQPLLQLIENKNVGMTAKGHAAWAIAFMQTTENNNHSSNPLFMQLNHESEDVRVAVVNALGAVAIGDALPSMSGNSTDDWNDDDENNNKNNNNQNDINIKESIKFKAIDAIVSALQDSHPQVRAEAVTALGNTGYTQHVKHIVTLLKDSDSEVRRCTALSIMKLGDVSYIDALNTVSENESEVDDVKNVARLAANTLRKRAEQLEEYDEIFEDDDEDSIWNQN